MKHYFRTLRLALGLSCLSIATVQAQGLQEENMEIFAELPDTLIYSSGVGAWGSEISIQEDGSFSGSFWDSDMGATGEGYPHGTLYLSEYEGQFEVPAKVSDTVYVTNLMYVTTKQEPHTEEIVDQIRQVYSEAVGIEGGNAFYLYLAGTPVSELPECVYYSPRWSFETDLTEVPEGECVLYNESEDICYVGYNASPYISSEDYSMIEELPENFVFASGAGAWGTEMTLSSDGSFSGCFHDSNMGETGPGYQNGTVYLSNFNGYYSAPVQISETSYEMTVTGIQIAEEPGTEELVADILYIYSEPYGMENAEQLILYLPGTPYSDMPEDAQRSPIWRNNNEAVLASDHYVLYNTADNHCFFGIRETVQDTTGTCEYILPFASSKIYSIQEINCLTLQEVNYAKNEIFAVHGRLFKSQELMDYFTSKSWYYGSIDANSFSDSVFNEYERGNIQRLVDRENELGGSEGYRLNQPGYDIHAVRPGYLDGLYQKKGNAVA